MENRIVCKFLSAFKIEIRFLQNGVLKQPNIQNKKLIQLCIFMAENDSFRLDIKIAKTQHSLHASRKLKFHYVLSCVQSRIDSGIRVKYLKHIWSNVTKSSMC